MPIERREYDIMKGETRTPEFLANVNTNGRIPVLQIGDRFIPESNAACHYLAEGSNLIPADRFDHADMLRWMFWEQYNHEPNIATMRFWIGWVGTRKSERATAAANSAQARGRRCGAEADGRASGRAVIGSSASAMTLADICLFAYTQSRTPAEFNLERYPKMVRWIYRVKAQPGFISIDA